MGITLGDLFVRIRGEQSSLDGDLDQAEKKTQASANRMGGFFSGAMQHAVGGAILGGISAVGGAVASASSQAFDATKNYESMTAALNTLLTKEIKGKDGVVDMGKARELAAEKTKELLKWSQQLAIQSPFSQDDVIKAMKMGIALGYTSDQAQRLTNANINFAAATGATGDSMSRITLALGQMQAKGKLAGGEMLQLTEAGVPMREILLESGKIAGLTTENFAKMQEKGLIPAKEAYEAYVGYMEKNFPTAAKDQANTLAGLQNSFEDLSKVVLRTAFEPMFRALQPYLVKFAEVLQNPALLATVQQIGAALGTAFGSALGALMNFFSVLGNNIAAGRNPLDALRLALLNVVPPEFIPIVNGVINALKTVVTDVGGLVAAFQTGGVGGLMTALGISPEVQGILAGIAGAIAGIATTITGLFTAGAGGASAGGIMSMLGISPEMQATITGIIGGVQSILSTLVGYVVANLPTMKAVATDVFNGIGWLIQNIIAPMLTFLVTKVGEVVGWISTNLPLALSVFSSFANTIMALFATAWPYIKQVALGALESLRAGIDIVLTLIKGIITGAMQILNGDWEGAWKTLQTTVETLWQDILKFVGGFPKAMLDIGKKIIDGLIEGVKSKATQFKEALLSILPPAIRAVLAQMGIASPSKVTMKIGNHIVDGLLVPFEKRINDVREAMSGLIQPMTQAPAMSGLSALAGAGAGGGGGSSVIVNMGGVSMANEMDAYSTAYRIAKRVKDGI